MHTIYKKFTLFLLVFVMAIAVIGCADTSSTFQTTTETSTTTTEATTAATTTQATTTETTTITTTEEQTTTETTTTTTEQTTTEETTTQTTTELTTSEFPKIEVIDIQKTEYDINSEFDYNSIVVVLVKASGPAIPLGSTVYTLSGFNSTVLGPQTITITYLTYETSFVITIVDPAGGLIITMDYYLSAQGLSGSELFDQLQLIINTGFHGVDYGTARTALAVSDRDPNNASNLILVYLGTSVSGAWDGGITWNREHVWPQSLLPDVAENSTVNTCSDLQNLKPANPAENSSRGNRYFDNIEIPGLSYVPRDEVKGDIARILLYMITMYDVLTLVDHNPGSLEMAMFSTLLQWHELDPVDDFERNRNNVIFSYQDNRNPFIDYPEFVDMIWGN